MCDLVCGKYNIPSTHEGKCVTSVVSVQSSIQSTLPTERKTNDQLLFCNPNPNKGAMPWLAKCVFVTEVEAE